MDAAAASQWAEGVAGACPVGGSAGAVFAQLLAALVQAQCLLAERGAYPPDQQRPLPQYDFVVVGAGSAGSAVAARLSENPGWRVLLLEAGDDPPPTADVPRLFPTLQGTEADWAYLTEADGRSSLALEGGRCPWPRGRALGGSSALNAMAHVRGSPQDYDGWAALGNAGWAYRDLLPFFRKLEDFDPQELASRPHTEQVHGRGGPISVTRPPHHGRAVAALKEAAQQLGYKLVDDFNAEPLDGFGEFHLTIRNGTRVNAALGYLGPAKDRENLHVVKRAHVTKVLIDPETRVTYGVQYTKDGETKEVRAAKEVVLSAGAINTPQILMLSGIGPKDHLDEMGIPVIRDLKVGYNLQDHVSYTGLFFTREGATRDVLTEAAFQYLRNRTGFLSSIGDTSFTGFVQTGIPVEGFPDVNSTGYPDMQFHFFMLEAAYPEGKRDYLRSLNFRRDVAEAVEAATAGRDALLAVPTLLAPVGRGRVRLRSADPRAPPAVQPAHLSAPADAARLAAGAALAARLAAAPALRDAGFRAQDAPLPPCAAHAPLSDAFWRCAVPHFTGTLYHPAGSAKMGPAGDADAVVDPRLRVYGVRNLRVADAAVMPLVVRANTNAAAMMIGEKCAHMLAQDWRHERRAKAPKHEL